LRTVGVQRVSTDGVDFVVKSGPSTTSIFDTTKPVAILHAHGKYVPGQQAEQWRADGKVSPIALDEVLHKVPHYTITGMVASTRIGKELDKHPKVSRLVCVLLTCRLLSRGLTGVFLYCTVMCFQERVEFKDKSHLTEIMQQTRIELENGDISDKELEESISVRN
jgi:hypothetical protein